MTDTVTVTLPIPSQLLGQNGRAQWWKRAEVVSAAKTLAWVAFRDAQGPGIRYEWPDPVRVKVTWCYAKGRPPDVDNCISRLKSYMDGAETAGVIQDDRQVMSYSVIFDHDSADPRVELTLERAT